MYHLAGSDELWYVCCHYFNLLWPSDAIWLHRSGSILAQAMAFFCLTARNHYLNQCWLIISKVLWHSAEDNLTGNTQNTYPWDVFENYYFKDTANELMDVDRVIKKPLYIYSQYSSWRTQLTTTVIITPIKKYIIGLRCNRVENWKLKTEIFFVLMMPWWYYGNDFRTTDPMQLEWDPFCESKMIYWHICQCFDLSNTVLYRTVLMEPLYEALRYWMKTFGPF